MTSELVLVAAVAHDRVIGKGNALLWSIPEDMKFFRAMTLGHAVIMGRKTHESIGRALPNRRNIVVTRDGARRFDGCERADSLDAAIALATQTDPAPRVIGGAELYALAMPRATELVITEVDQRHDGDARFPVIDPAVWVEVSRAPAQTEGVSFVRYRRRA